MVIRVIAGLAYALSVVAVTASFLSKRMSNTLVPSPDSSLPHQVAMTAPYSHGMAYVPANHEVNARCRSRQSLECERHSATSARANTFNFTVVRPSRLGVLLIFSTGFKHICSFDSILVSSKRRLRWMDSNAIDQCMPCCVSLLNTRNNCDVR
jgi:hypothetical protein